jgi:hypothetical protein
MAWLAARNVPRNAHDTGANRLMHRLLWMLGSMFEGFEQSIVEHAPFPGFEYREN